MSLAEVEAPSSRIFGEITRESMANSAELARLVMRIVRDACQKRARGGMTVQQVAEGLRDGRFRLWGVMAKADANLEAIAVTEAADGVFNVHVVGPQFGDFSEFLPMFDAIARGQRCERLAFVGPGAFGRDLRKQGWFEREIRYEKLVESAR